VADNHADGLVIRQGGPDDVPAVLALLDGAAHWLAEQGRTGQWGTEPQSTNLRRLALTAKWAVTGGLHLAWLDERPVGALAVGDAPEYVPPSAEPELYVSLLVTDRARAGHGIGARLLERARELAQEQGAGVLRVDCYGGDDRALVRYYERQGFTATEPFTVNLPSGPWPGQILEKRVGWGPGTGQPS
jgi:GNAT superfamily N-acetyltransferase